MYATALERMNADSRNHTATMKLNIPSRMNPPNTQTAVSIRHRAVEKVRRTFHWDGWEWELDFFTSPPGIVLLELELPSTDAEVNGTPPWLTVIEEVSTDPRWTSTWLALIREAT